MEKLYRSTLYCDECFAEFEHPSSLERHMTIHSDWRPHRCEQCDKLFKNSVGLKQHMLVHSDERNFFCDFCTDRFKQIGHLLRHRKSIHQKEGGDVFKCDPCRLTFKSWHQLCRHVKLHRDVSSRRREEQLSSCSDLLLQDTAKDSSVHACSVCGSRFETENGLKVHKSVEHPLTGYEEVTVVEGNLYLEERLESLDLLFPNLSVVVVKSKDLVRSQ